MTRLAVLVEALGETAVAFLAGANRRATPALWLSGTEPIPELSQLRLDMAYQVWEVLTAEHNPDVARRWLTGTKPRLDHRSPLEGLRAGDLNTAFAAAQAFADGTDG
ncbi:hypothetical protein FNH13_17660 [Ornithinimicrobium ciconiae]|uniref:Antitoxin Xre/MbcA/ParS-like toxin-binding domain-containing protein n=1 Tax=Ornithinimicrobium ciconiae TaxID=2594265 RepID=A0A516GEL0_9MICO|nr:hypothetical protein [Ornithinimicrobium ciconiae]QDO89928.1 hypothetical protein FNH13_17660 [Ornithinimicrobium ciconiae]